MTQTTHAERNGKPEARLSSTDLSEVLAGTTNATNGNATNGNAHQNGGAQNGTPDVRPDVQRTVVDAARIAEARQMPLRIGAMQNGNSSADIDYSNGARRVDIAVTLDGIASQMREVETEIERLITSPVKLVSDIAGHTLGAGGKRLRPSLTILAAQLCGDSESQANARAITCAAVMELTHTTALIHDDVVDGAQTRRGKPAANLVWGNETSVLVGDYLCAQAFVTVAKPEFRDVLPFVAQATAELCAGELLETQTRGFLSMSEAQYLDIIALKTASLTGCACRVGAMTADASIENQEKLARYGRDLGLAFQIVDDVFDVVASEKRIGKPVGNDIREGDITLPMLRAMQVVSEKERDELCEIVGKDGISDDEVERVLLILRGCDCIEYSMSMARRFVESARSQLDEFRDGCAKTALCDIADYVLSREK